MSRRSCLACLAAAAFIDFQAACCGFSPEPASAAWAALPALDPLGSGPSGHPQADPLGRGDSLAALPWPKGTQVLRFEDLEGAILVPATLAAAPDRDTSGVFVLDTGAGFLALDFGLARALGIADTVREVAAIGLAARPLARVELGSLVLDQVSPVLTVDARVIRRVTGRPVLGLLGQGLIHGRTILLDYSEGTLVLLPTDSGSAQADGDTSASEEHMRQGVASADPLSAESDPSRSVMGSYTSPRSVLLPALSSKAVGVPFRLAGDGKMLVKARVAPGLSGRAPEPLDLIVDTGATKSVFFRAALNHRVPGWTSWPSIRGLVAPTLTGDATAEVVRVPEIELHAAGRAVLRRGMDAVVIRGDLGEALSDEVGETVDGLLGYSFLKHYRIGIDSRHRLLWFDPARGDVADRPYEYSHVGIQLEDSNGAARVMGVANDSPAARVGVEVGDELLAIDGQSVAGLDVVTVARRLEGKPGTPVDLTMRRGRREWICRLLRKQLL